MRSRTDSSQPGDQTDKASGYKDRQMPEHENARKRLWDELVLPRKTWGRRSARNEDKAKGSGEAGQHQSSGWKRGRARGSRLSRAAFSPAQHDWNPLKSPVISHCAMPVAEERRPTHPNCAARVLEIVIHAHSLDANLPWLAHRSTSSGALPSHSPQRTSVMERVTLMVEAMGQRDRSCFFFLDDGRSPPRDGLGLGRVRPATASANFTPVIRGVLMILLILEHVPQIVDIVLQLCATGRTRASSAAASEAASNG